MRASGFAGMPKLRAGRPRRSVMRVALSFSAVIETRKSMPVMRSPDGGVAISARVRRRSRVSSTVMLTPERASKALAWSAQ